MEWTELSRQGVGHEEPRTDSVMGYTYQAGGIWSVEQADIAHIVQKALITSGEWAFHPELSLG